MASSRKFGSEAVDRLLVHLPCLLDALEQPASGKLHIIAELVPVKMRWPIIHRREICMLGRCNASDSTNLFRLGCTLNLTAHLIITAEAGIAFVTLTTLAFSFS